MSSRWKISANKGTPEKVVLSFWTESSKNWKVVFYPNPLMVLCFRGWYIWIKKSRRTIVYKQKISLIFASCLHSLHASHTVWILDIDWLYNVFSFFSVSSKEKKPLLPLLPLLPYSLWKREIRWNIVREKELYLIKIMQSSTVLDQHRFHSGIRWLALASNNYFPFMRVFNKFFGLRDFPHLRLGFGILKRNRGEIRDWKYALEVECQK